MDPITISVGDAKKAIGIGHTKLYQLIASGDLETIKVGGRRLVKTASIRKLLAA